MPSGLYASLCHAFLVLFIYIPTVSSAKVPGWHGNLAAGTRPILHFSSSIDPPLMPVPSVKNDYGRTYFDELMPTCLRGAVFFETQCMFTH